MSTPTGPAKAASVHTVLVDFDGVLVRGDAFALFLRRVAFAGVRLPLAVVLLVLLAPAAAIPAWRLRVARWMSWVGLSGRSADWLRTELGRFGADLGTEPGRIIAPGLRTVQAHLAAGDRVVVVTACEHTLARAVLDRIGLSAVELVASQIDGPKLLVHNHGATKLAQLAAQGVRPPWRTAYSDSLSDLPILDAAEQAVLVNADSRRVARARRLLGDRLTTVTWNDDGPESPASDAV
ncbi:haloacid dehalogenase-like hydrolase [Micromonospora sp. WMMD967]|uniref:haloacid dehalogenase-like hydrolase n=1 Tax=Micromonospora sp. WMMD967 TaxID=3016101 RepID=UPI0024163249|nr:haloacid dehalogenase-like hydrolase [Micromonospora sp. WMMD967]MDG4838627.1 haloacid dehalogenase-like hydrolase [Micromonospora sp. WMMD967]